MNSTGVKSGGSQDSDRRARRTKRSIRFSDSEWRQVETAAAEQREMKPGQFVRAAAAVVAAGEIDLDDGRLTPELIELIGRTFRGMHLLAHLKREELAAKGKEDAFKRAVEAGELAEAETFGHEDSNDEDR